MVSNKEILAEVKALREHNQEVCSEVKALREQVAKLTEMLQLQKDRKDYQKAYYKKRKAAKENAVKRLRNPDKNLFDGYRNLDVHHEEWVAKMKEFVEAGHSVYNFLTWLAWDYNQNTWEFSPITKSSGYMHVFIGRSGNKALRSRYTELDIHGQIRANKFTNSRQIETFKNALFWKYANKTIGVLAEDIDGEPLKSLPQDWQEVTRSKTASASTSARRISYSRARRTRKFGLF